MPDVTVIVPALNAARSLERTLASVADQDFDGTSEVIVVDDGSTDASPQIAERNGASVIRHPRNLGAAAARNRGAAAARAGVLAFTDADCEPSPRWLSCGLRALEEADLVQGAVSPKPGSRISPLDRTLWVTEESGLYESANLFVRREIFNEVGGFRSFLADDPERSDSPFTGFLPRLGEAPFGEDIWFGWRVRRAGARTAFCPEALVHHEVVRLRPRAMAAHFARVRFFPALLREVPELRRGFLYRRWFLTRRSAAFDLAAIGLAAAARLRHPAPLLAGLPYLGLGLRGAGGLRRGALLHVAGRIAADVVISASLIAGSVAARRLIL